MTNQTEALNDAFSCAAAALNGPLPRGAVGAILETLRARVDAALSSQPPVPREMPEINEKDINRWQALIQERPEGPWEMGNGGSFDRTLIKPISDDMLAELANWLRMGYTPWNGRSMPLSAGDRQFMYMLYFSVQGLIARARTAEKELAARASLTAAAGSTKP